MPERRIYGRMVSSIVGCATFPPQKDVDPKDKASHPERGRVLVLQPGDSYRVFWDMTINGCTGEREPKGRLWNDPLVWFEEKWQRIVFKPGPYRVYMDVVVHSDGTEPYRTTTDGRDAHVSASQQMVLLGAFLGGILAYVLKRYYGVGTQLV